MVAGSQLTLIIFRRRIGTYIHMYIKLFLFQIIRITLKITDIILRYYKCLVNLKQQQFCLLEVTPIPRTTL